MSMLQVEAVTRLFGGFKAVDHVSLRLAEREILGIAGTNGAGKSTLFAAIAGQQPADAGRIAFAGQDITRLPPHRRARLGLVRTFQIPREFKSLTVHENLMAAAANPQGERLVNAFFQTRSLRDHEAQLAAKADGILQFLNLARVRDVPAGGLSGGQKKLVEPGPRAHAGPALHPAGRTLRGREPGADRGDLRPCARACRAGASPSSSSSTTCRRSRRCRTA